MIVASGTLPTQEEPTSLLRRVSPRRHAQLSATRRAARRHAHFSLTLFLDKALAVTLPQLQLVISSPPPPAALAALAASATARLGPPPVCPRRSFTDERRSKIRLRITEFCAILILAAGAIIEPVVCCLAARLGPLSVPPSGPSAATRRIWP